jgi:hypothetical protein
MAWPQMIEEMACIGSHFGSETRDCRVDRSLHFRHVALALQLPGLCESRFIKDLDLVELIEIPFCVRMGGGAESALRVN